MLYFFIGVVFILVALPLLNCISSLFESVFNFFISMFNFLAAKVNSKIIQIQRECSEDECESSPMNLIGFQSRPKEEYYDDEDEDD